MLGGKSVRTVKRMVLRGELEAIDRGRMITESQLAKYIERQESESCQRAEALRRESGNISSSPKRESGTSPGSTEPQSKPAGIALVREICGKRS